MTTKVSLAPVKALLSLQEVEPELICSTCWWWKVKFPVSPDSTEELGTGVWVKHFGLSCQSERNTHDYTTSDMEGVHSWMLMLSLNGNNPVIWLNCHLKPCWDEAWALLYGIIIIQKQRLISLILFCPIANSTCLSAWSTPWHGTKSRIWEETGTVCIFLSAWLVEKVVTPYLCMENRLAQYVPDLLFSLGHHSGYTSRSRLCIRKPRCYWHTNESYLLLFPPVCSLSVKTNVRERELLSTEMGKKERRKGRGRDQGRYICICSQDTYYNKDFFLIST